MIQSLLFVYVAKLDVISSYMRISHAVRSVYCIPEETDWVSILTLIFTMLSTGVAIISVFVTLIGVFVAYKINDSVQAAECTKMYFSSDMLKAIRTLFKINVADRQAREKEREKEKKEKKRPWTEQEDAARRLVKSYFQLAYELRYKRFLPISENTLRRICDVDALKLYFNVIEWMEWRLTSNYNTDPFLKLKESCGDIYEKICSNGLGKEEPKDIKYFEEEETFMTREELEGSEAMKKREYYVTIAEKKVAGENQK